MSGAVSFVLSLLGLGASGAVSVGQSVSRKKADYEFGEAHGYHGTPDAFGCEIVSAKSGGVCVVTYIMHAVSLRVSTEIHTKPHIVIVRSAGLLPI